jgi:hypothetical protein
VADVAALVRAVGAAATDPRTAVREHGDARAATIARAWGDSLDGRSSERYWLTLRRILDERTPE